MDEQTMIAFDEDKHAYSKGGKTYISVTQLLQKYGLSASYAGIPADILAKAAKRGTAIHKALEAFIKTNYNDGSQEVAMLQQYVNARGIDTLNSRSEVTVYDDVYGVAGTYDWWYTDDTENILSDFKSTSSLHMDAVSWQLSIYNFLECKGDTLSYYLTKLKVFHFSNGRMYVKDVPTIEYGEVERLLKAHLNGDATFVYVKDTSAIVTDAEDKLLSQIITEIDAYKKAIKELESKAEKLQAPILERMERTYNNRVTTSNLEITYIYETTRKVIDKNLVEKLSGIHGFTSDDYTKVSTIKPRLKVEAINR